LWIPVALGGWFCVVVAALWVPLDLSLTIDTTREKRFTLGLAWLFGAIRIRIGEGARKPKAGEKKKAEGRRRWPALQILRTRGMAAATAKLGRRILRCLEIRDFRGDFLIGLDDPADTGMLFGALIPAAIALSSLTGNPFTIRPSFEGRVFEGRTGATLRLSPLRALWAITRFAFSVPALRALKRVVRSG
jgi:hypothetical protein